MMCTWIIVDDWSYEEDGDDFWFKVLEFSFPPQVGWKVLCAYGDDDDSGVPGEIDEVEIDLVSGLFLVWFKEQEGDKRLRSADHQMMKAAGWKLVSKDHDFSRAVIPEAEEPTP